MTQTLGGVTTNYSYGTKNDLLTTISMGGVTTQTINYTGDGNMANLTPGIQAPGGSLITALGWNQNARLSAIKSGSNILARYDYDGFGQRVVKTLSATDVTLYQYGQDGMLLEEATYKGEPLADYIYMDGRSIATLTPSGTLYFLHDDMLGTPQLATDSSQNLAWQATYTPFGKASVSGTLTQNLRLPGQFYDSEGGWNHNGFRNYLPDLGRYAEPDPLATPGRARYYHPQTGRFLSEAPPNFAGNKSNVYAYALDDPLDFKDPFGLQAEPTTPFDPTATPMSEFGEGAAYMWRNYRRMEQRKWIGADKYYHCMGNCQATNAGSGGAFAAQVISFFRTDVLSRFREPTDWRNDDVANHCGQKGGDCQKRCAGFIPLSSPGRPQFPGW